MKIIKRKTTGGGSVPAVLLFAVLFSELFLHVIIQHQHGHSDGFTGRLSAAVSFPVQNRGSTTTGISAAHTGIKRKRTVSLPSALSCLIPVMFDTPL